jgi:hypothetical protein
MPTNLTGTKINVTFGQLLHVDGGPTATEKTVYSGTGVATALKIGTVSISATFSAITFLNKATARAALDLGTMATQPAFSVAITGGTIDDVNITNATFGSLTLVNATSITTSNLVTGVTLTGNTLTADGTNANIDINITPKGTGEVNVTNIDVLSGKVPFDTITNRAYAAFSDITDQTGSTTVPAAVKFGTVEVAGSGITMVSDGTNLTRLTFAIAGTYSVMPNLQLSNTDGNDHDAIIWFALNGANIARSTTRITVPKVSEGGNAFFQIVFYVTVTAGQYLQLFWLPENTAVTLDHTAAVTGPPAIPATPSAILSVERIA